MLYEITAFNGAVDKSAVSRPTMKHKGEER
jgi:hypothetical protein